MEKTDKITRILKLYYQLLVGKPVNKVNFCLENGISERSFDRDIEDIRLFLSDEQSFCELEFDRGDSSYFLTQTFGEEMSIDITFLLIDILLSMKTISKSETEGVIEAILCVTGMQASKDLKEYIKNRIEYKCVWGDKAILKMHRDLVLAIYNKAVIKMQYEIQSDVVEERIVYPVSINVDDGFFYLRAFIMSKNKESPAVFRLDRIKSFVMKNSCQFDDAKVQQFFNECKQRNTYHMLSGEKVDIKLKAKSSFGRVITDIFPNTITVQTENEDYSVYHISTYKYGFINWVLGQEDVIVMEPQEIRKEIIDRMKKTLTLYSVV